MIDIENIVVNNVIDALESAYGEASPIVYSEYVEIPSEFPCVTVYEADNNVYRQSQDNYLMAHHVNVMYEVNVFCADANDKKSTAKAIADVVDTAMQSMKFTRTIRSQIPNQDRTIYRITMRYTAVVGEPSADEDMTTYQMYRQ